MALLLANRPGDGLHHRGEEDSHSGHISVGHRQEGYISNTDFVFLEARHCFGPGHTGTSAYRHLAVSDHSMSLASALELVSTGRPECRSADMVLPRDPPIRGALPKAKHLTQDGR